MEGTDDVGVGRLVSRCFMIDVFRPCGSDRKDDASTLTMVKTTGRSKRTIFPQIPTITTT